MLPVTHNDCSTPPDRSILVLGASSLIGHYLLPQLAALGSVQVHALSRTNTGYGNSDPRSPVIWHRGDLREPDCLPANMSSDTLISLAPVWVLADFLADAPNSPVLQAIGRMVAFSSTSVFSKPHSSDSRERALAARLLTGEQKLQDWCARQKVALTLLRPTLIYDGINDRNITRIARLLCRFPFFPLAYEGRGLRSPVHAGDLATAVVSALQTPATAGKSYNLMGGEILSYRAMVERIAVACNKKIHFIALPAWSVPLVALLRSVPRLRGLNAAMLKRMGDDLVFDDGSARTDFVWSPRRFQPLPPRECSLPASQ